MTRVVVVTDRRLGHVLKVFDRDDDGWDRAHDWVDDSEHAEENTRIVCAGVN